MTEQELSERIQSLLDGTIPPQKRAELERILVDDEAARVLYLDMVEIHNLLDEREDRPALPGQVVPMDRVVVRQKRRNLRRAALAAAAVAVCGAIVAVFIALPEPPLVRFVVSPDARFMVTHATAEDEESPEGDALAVGSRVKLISGILELNFGSGVRGVVLAPADFTLRSESLVGLSHGTGWFEVSEEASGFQVDTSDFLLTDLGTEFGVTSSPEGRDEVHVFAGEVEVRHHRGSGEAVLLTAAQARAAGPAGEWEKIDFFPGRFAQAVPTTPIPPYLYWSFDRFGDDDTLPVEGTHPAVGTFVASRGFSGEGPEVVEGKVGGAFSFDAARDHIKTDWWGISGSGPRSVAFWLRLPTPAEVPVYDANLVAWGGDDAALRGTNDTWSIRASARDGQMIPDQLRDKIREKTMLHLRFGVSNVLGSTDLADGRWHHVAVCFKGKMNRKGNPVVDLYVDGKKEHIRHFQAGVPRYGERPPPVNTQVGKPNLDCIPLVVGRHKNKLESSCNADIDELYIFEGVLTPSIVRLLLNASEGWVP